MENRIIFFVTILLFCSCIRQTKCDIVYSEINNEELKEQISLYINFTDSAQQYGERLIYVKFMKVNDTTVYFDISNHIFDADLQENLRFNFICRVDNRDILFLDDAANTISEKGEYYYFKTDDKIKEKIIKKNFPQSSRVRYFSGGREMRIVCTYHPYNFHLIFINDKLVSKEIERGCMWLFFPRSP